MADEDLDSLYWAEPGAFTAQRTKLADDAKARGDADAEQAQAEALAALRDAEREFRKAQDNYDTAKRASRAAAESVKQAKAQLNRA